MRRRVAAGLDVAAAVLAEASEACLRLADRLERDTGRPAPSWTWQPTSFREHSHVHVAVGRGVDPDEPMFPLPDMDLPS